MIRVAHRTPRTAAGCAALVAAGATAFELDVQLRDGRLIVSHYLPFLRRPGWFEHDNWRFRWRAGPPFDADLADLVDVVPAGATILLDPKLTGPDQRTRLSAALADALPDRDRFVVSTSNPGDLGRYRAAGFRTWRTIGTPAHLPAVLAGGPLPDAAVTVRHTLLGPSTIAALHELTPTVLAWTVNDVGRARQLRAAGIDGITSDNARVLTALREQDPET